MNTYGSNNVIGGSVVSDGFPGQGGGGKRRTNKKRRSNKRRSTRRVIRRKTRRRTRRRKTRKTRSTRSRKQRAGAYDAGAAVCPAGYHADEQGDAGQCAPDLQSDPATPVEGVPPVEGVTPAERARVDDAAQAFGENMRKPRIKKLIDRWQNSNYTEDSLRVLSNAIIPALTKLGIPLDTATDLVATNLRAISDAAQEHPDTEPEPEEELELEPQEEGRGDDMLDAPALPRPPRIPNRHRREALRKERRLCRTPMQPKSKSLRPMFRWWT
jgi:hypothetical protein